MTTGGLAIVLWWLAAPAVACSPNALQDCVGRTFDEVRAALEPAFGAAQSSHSGKDRYLGWPSKGVWVEFHVPFIPGGRVPYLAQEIRLVARYPGPWPYDVEPRLRSRKLVEKFGGRAVETAKATETHVTRDRVRIVVRHRYKPSFAGPTPMVILEHADWKNAATIYWNEKREQDEADQQAALVARQPSDHVEAGPCEPDCDEGRSDAAQPDPYARIRAVEAKQRQALFDAVRGPDGPAGLLFKECKHVLDADFPWPAERTVEEDFRSRTSVYSGSRWQVTCEGGRAGHVLLERGFSGPLPHGLTWEMTPRAVKKHFKRQEWTKAIRPKSADDYGVSGERVDGADALVEIEGATAKLFLIWREGALAYVEAFR